MKSTKTFIYLIRHGECTGNKEGRIRGRLEFPLNETGIKQAHALAAAMKGKGIEYIYSSPLSRAADTAKILGDALGLPYETREGFNDICIGTWENRIKAELAVEQPEKWKQWIEDPDNVSFEGGESMAEVRRRTLAELNKVVSEHPGSTMALVAHRGVLKPLVSEALGIGIPSYWRIHFDTASYSLLTYDDDQGFCLMGLNYTQHLTDAGLSVVQEFD